MSAAVMPRSGQPSAPRVAAHVLDGIITALPVLPAALVMLLGPTRLTECTISASGDITDLGGPANGICTVPANSTVAIAVTLLIAAILVAIAHLGRHRGTGARRTFGAWVLRLRPRDPSAASTMASEGVTR